MDIFSLTLIAIGLSLDAFGVAISIGICKGISNKNKIAFCLSFGFFQFLFALIGAFAGFLFNTYIAAVPKIIGGIIIALVGIIMIKEGLDEKNENCLVDPKMCLVLGVSVSIDAMVIGFTVLNKINSISVILEQTVFIGLVTLIISAIGFEIARYLKRIKLVTKYADFLGGIILILFGLKMIFF